LVIATFGKVTAPAALTQSFAFCRPPSSQFASSAEQSVKHRESNMQRRLIQAGLVLLTLLGINTLASGEPNNRPETDAATAFHALLEESWEFNLREDPVWATRVGDHRWNDRLGRNTLADQQRRERASRDFLKRLDAIDRDALVRADQINYDIFRRALVDGITESEFESYLMPITNRWGFHIAMPELPRQVPLKTVKDYENYVARLNDFSRVTDEHIELMRQGIKQGLTLPAVVLADYRQPIEAHIVDNPTKSLFYGPLEKLPETFSDAERQSLRQAARAAIQSSIVPGYKKFLEFMEQQYVPNCRSSVGASALPRGREFYRFAVRKFTTLDLTPEQVHQTGLDEVKRIRGEMDAIIKEVGFDGDFAAFVEFLRTDPRFYAKTSDELLKDVAYTMKKMEGQLPRLFGKLPRTPCGIREVPAYIAPQTTAAYYMQPAGDRTVAGFYYVNTYDLKSRPLYSIEALSFHEAVPGHHLQLALQQEIEDLPPFRRFAGFTAFIEGWGLYSERLGLEVGFYEDPYSNFGRLNYEMWRACRLVVDTGIHYFGWSRQQAIDYLATNSAMSLHNIRAEVDRYISWPGQALAYKTGELKIRQLRALAEERLGGRFDVRQFHDVVLGSGSVPLSVLEDNVKQYLATVESSASRIQ
jgi:uncharacterized protein (DUF885 family)